MRPLLRILIAALLGAPAPLLAQAGPPDPAVQISAAVAPLPEQFRGDATVLGYRAGERTLVELRRGGGAFICLADDPAEARFHVACYHRSLEPFMARGRQLRAEERSAAVDSIRDAEIVAGKLPMPSHPAALYSLTAREGAPDANTGLVAGARSLYVVYIPFATAESTGLPTTPLPNAPWLMFPGTARAHIMFVPQM